MCSYKVVTVKFEVWGLQTRAEAFIHSAIRDVLLLGHKQAFTWIDDWIDLTMDDLRRWEKEIQSETNKMVVGTNPPTPTTPKEIDLNNAACAGGGGGGGGGGGSGGRTPTTPRTPSSMLSGFGFFSSTSTSSAAAVAAAASKEPSPSAASTSSSSSTK